MSKGRDDAEHAEPGEEEPTLHRLLCDSMGKNRRVHMRRGSPSGASFLVRHAHLAPCTAH